MNYKKLGTEKHLHATFEYDSEDTEAIHELAMKTERFIFSLLDEEARVMFYAGLSGGSIEEIRRKKNFLRELYGVFMKQIVICDEEIPELLLKLESKIGKLAAANAYVEMIKYRHDLLVTVGTINGWTEFLSGVLVGRQMLV